MKTSSSIIFFLTRSLFLGFGLSLLFLQTGKDSYLGAIIGLMIGLIFSSFYTYIIKHKNGKSLKEIFKTHKIIGTMTRFLLLFTSFILLIYVLVIYKIFVVSFLLVNTPSLFVTVPFIILATYCAFKGLKVISRVAGSLLPISILLCIFTFGSLAGYMETTNFLPILTVKPLNFISSLFTFAGISSLPNILSLHFHGNTKGYIKMYLLASLFLILTLISVNGVFGENLVSIFRFPEYMVLKQLKLFKFIEKVENILSIAWIFDLFVTASMSIYSIRELLPEKKNKLTTCIILAIIIYIIDKVFAFNYINELKIYYVLPYISLIIPVIIIIFMLYLVKRNNS